MLRKFVMIVTLSCAGVIIHCNDSPCDVAIQESMETAALLAALCARDEEACADTVLEEDLRRVSFYCFYHDDYELSTGHKISATAPGGDPGLPF